jgi:signal transduction histidine kinase
MHKANLDALYRQRTIALGGVAGLYYALMAAAHGFLVPPPAQGVMIACALSTALGCLGLRIWLQGTNEHFRQVEGAAAAMFLMATINVTLHAILLHSPDQALFLPLMAIGFAFLSPSLVVLGFMLLVQGMAGVAIALWSGPGLSTTVLFVIGSALAGGWFGGVFALRTNQQLQHGKELAEKLAAEMEDRVQDRTQDLMQAMETAQKANGAKSDFLAVMSHELRTPLNAIIGYSEIMREGAVDDQRQQDVHDLDRVLVASRRLLQLITGVLDFSKIEAGRLELDLRCVDVQTLVSDALETVRPLAEANGNILGLRFGANVGEIMTDDFRLGQCLLNLLSNAAKFTKNGAITVDVAREDDRIRFEVADTGVGISQDQLARLFQPFSQADSSMSRSYGGTGLGLAITRELAQLLGGEVEVTSALGRGSVFSLTVAVDAVTVAAKPAAVA